MSHLDIRSDIKVYIPTTLSWKKMKSAISYSKSFLNPLSVHPTKWSNTLKQVVGNLPTSCLSEFAHFVGLALKGLNHSHTLRFSFLLITTIIRYLLLFITSYHLFLCIPIFYYYSIYITLCYIYLSLLFTTNYCYQLVLLCIRVISSN